MTSRPIAYRAWNRPGLAAGASDGLENSWTGGRDEARPVGWPGGSLTMVLEADAVQVPRKPLPQVSQGEISGNELARVRCCSAAAVL
jgi:hypothetical protein